MSNRVMCFLRFLDCHSGAMRSIEPGMTVYN
jgi:hypothetical protein